MQNLKTNLLFGLLVWLIPFAVSFIVYPLRSTDRLFFESIMSLLLIITTVWATAKVRNKAALHLWQTGLLWLVISLALDQLFFTWGPQKLVFLDYWKTIGIDYLTIPLVTWLGYTPIQKDANKESEVEKVVPDSELRQPDEAI